jgi:hypothetical protein
MARPHRFKSMRNVSPLYWSYKFNDNFKKLEDKKRT